MTAAFVLFVEIDRVVHAQLAHVFRKRLSFDFDKQMVMVGHEAVVVDGDVVVSGIQSYQLFEVFVVFLVFEDDSLFDATIDNVVKTVNLYAGFSGHALLSSGFMYCNER